MMFKNRISLGLVPACAAAVLLTLPVSALAYLNPYDVLLSQDLLLPASSRESLSRVDRQQRESTARREREQEAIFAEQNPPLPEEDTLLVADEADEEIFRAAAPEDLFYAEEEYIDREMLALLRAMSRLKEQQTRARAQEQALQLLAQEGLHAGAPLLGKGVIGKGVLPTQVHDLAPTGAGTVLVVMTLVIGIVWTLRRVRRDEKLTRA